MQHYFINQELAEKQRLTLPPDIQKHLVKVIRAKARTQFELVGTKPTTFRARLLNPETGEAEITAAKDFNSELPVEVTIVCGLPKGNKAELIVQKAVELGVSRIIFLPSDWAIAKWGTKANRKIQRLNKIARSAAEQSHRNVIPPVSYLDSFDQLKTIPADQKVVAYEESAKQGETSELVKVLGQLKPKNSLLSLFGPEGGISPAEIKKLLNWGFHLVGLGPRILRTETAPLYFLSAVSMYFDLMKK